MEKGMEMGQCACHHDMFGKHTYMLIGTLVFVWGFINYLMVAQGWPMYSAWMVGGVLLVVIGWVKKWMYMRKGM